MSNENPTTKPEVDKTTSNVKNYHRIISDGNKEIEVTIREHIRRKLRPLSVINNIASVMTYLPLETKIKINERVTSDFNTYPVFITSERKLLDPRVDNIEGFQLFETITGEEPRWEPSDVIDYLNSTQKVSLKDVFEYLRNKAGSIIELKSPDYLNVYFLWAIGTLFNKLFEYYPYLDFSGSKGAGKTKALLILECICYNAKMSHRISGPGWARIVESLSCTLLIDEQEDLQHPKTEHSANMLTLLNSAFRTHAQQMILVPERGSSWKMKNFEIAVPVALGHISPLNDVTEDRAIPMKMVISSNKKVSDVEVDQEDIDWKKIRNFLYRSFLDYFDEVIKIRSEPIELDKISPRERNQIWKPIIILARLFERHGVEGLEKSILNVIEETHELKKVNNQSRNKDVQVLEILGEAIVEKKIHFINEEKENENWFKQEAILGQVHENIDLRYMSPRELGTILDRLRLTRKKRNPHNTCVFVTHQILGKLYQSYHLKYQKLEANLALEAQKIQTQSAESATSASVSTIGDEVNETKKHCRF